MTDETTGTTETDDPIATRIKTQLEAATTAAETARAKGLDPEPTVEIPAAEDLAARVENILSIPGVAARVRELEPTMTREEAALELTRDFAEGRVGEFTTREARIEAAVRTAVALLTEGVVAAPIEGIDRVEIHPNDDGTEFVRIYYAGPIRSAGGTAQALSVLVADYARTLLGLAPYNPRPEEIERYAEEVTVYDNDVGLQYAPKEAETKFIAEHCPVMLDGEPTSDQAVSGYRDLERVNTNRARGGMCLVLAEGIALKGPKIKRYTTHLDDVDWPWLDDLIHRRFDDATPPTPAEPATPPTPDPTPPAPAAEHPNQNDPPDRPRPTPKSQYLRDLIAGRPVLGHPSRPGGFRLRYGRARNHGFATAGVHPATMHLVDDFLAAGTQLKTERPGKAAGVVPVDTIDGPTVKLDTGEIRRLDTPEDALTHRDHVTEILDLGEYLVNYGEFLENNHPLAPAAYAYEWWIQDLEAAGAPVQALHDDPRIDLDHPTPRTAIDLATDYDAPLHPDYTYLWHDLTPAEFTRLADALEPATTTATLENDRLTITIPYDEQTATTLETLLVPHTQHPDPPGTITIPDALPLITSLGYTHHPDDPDRPALERTRTDTDLTPDAQTAPDAIQAVNETAPYRVQERAPTRIGARMGRPEKSESRDMNPAVHVLFPLGNAGGDQRDLAAASRDGPPDTRGHHTLELARRTCPECDTTTHHHQCPDCHTHTTLTYHCPRCNTPTTPDQQGRTDCPRCNTPATPATPQHIDLNHLLHTALENVNERETAFEILKGVKGLTSTTKTPEPIEKGILRAKHDVTVFKDGTIRYDITDLPVTSVRPQEIGVTPEDLRDLGYHTDLHGDPLEYDDQLIPLHPQDVVLSTTAGDHLLKVANFVDDLLTNLYDQPPYYNVDDRSDLIGELVFGLAPHTSAAVVGRIIGFTTAAAGYAHPYFHAAKRRNCFHPDTKLWYQNEHNEWRHETIQTLVENRLTNPRTDDIGTQTQQLDGNVLVPSITTNGTLTTKPVTHISKHPASDHAVRITTRSGRQLTVTPDHEIHVHDGDRITTKPAMELLKGDRVVTPRHLDVITPSTDNPRFDLLEEFLACPTVENDDLMIRGIPKDTLYDLFDHALADAWDDGPYYTLQSTANHLQLSHKTLSNYAYRESVPASLLLELLGTPEAVTKLVPDDVQLGMRRDRVSINRHVEINQPAATLLGYYTAEGFTREQKTAKGTVHQTTITGSEEQARQFFLDTFEGHFGADPYPENPLKITVSGRLMRTFFDTILNAAKHADTKRIPQCIFNAPDPIAAAYLSGYFSGDGGVHNDGLVVTATTVSRELKEDLVSLLVRFGITARVEESEPEFLHKKFPDHYDSSDLSKSARGYIIYVTSTNAVRFAKEVGFHLERKHNRLTKQVGTVNPRQTSAFTEVYDDFFVESIKDIVETQSRTEHTYCLTVKDTHALFCNSILSVNCDGDEDCVMLVMDGLLNFSKSYLPSSRGGSMDAPLVMSVGIDAGEIDDEAHNIDIVGGYSREFYEATRGMVDPGEVGVRVAEDTLGSDEEGAGFLHTHDTSDIAGGPGVSAYKTLGSMGEKLEAQLELARKLRGVDETDVAERIIEYHFLPDLLGNLRAFSRQDTRCHACGTKYRRPPLMGSCRECGGEVHLTVHEGSVDKYLETAIEVAEGYGAGEYTRQRLYLLEGVLVSMFENDKDKPTTIADFMGPSASPSSGPGLGG